MEIKATDKPIEPTVSVIIPMFNVEHVMDRCLHSLSKQSLKSVELLFVDDSSTDETVRKLQGWIELQNDTCNTYKLIRHNSNQGVAAARNTGLRHACGKYVYFVDADDYIEPNTLQTLYINAEENELDIVGCEWFLSFRQNERYMSQPDVQSGEELFYKMALGTMRWNLWLFLVKRSLYETHQIYFLPKMNMGEDMMVMLKLSLHANKVRICHEPFYHYMQTNTNSLTKRYQESIPQITANIKEIEQYLSTIGREDLHEYICLLQLNVKRPFLISYKNSDYKIWLEWFPESNSYIESNKECSWYTTLIQKAARSKHFWFLKLYYWIVIKVRYGLMYR